VSLSVCFVKLSGLLEVSQVEAGLQTVGRLKNGVSAIQAAAAAAKHDVEVVPLSRHASGRPSRSGENCCTPSLPGAHTVKFPTQANNRLEWATPGLRWMDTAFARNIGSSNPAP
jgi:hypothetical protein